MKAPVEVLIGSGLGNQMFQYALGRSLSIRLRRPLILDTSLLFQEPGWGFDLHHMRLGPHRVRNWPFLPWRIRSKLLRVLASHDLEVMRWITEPSLQFASEVFEGDRPCVLNGYWQSERYFHSISDQLRKDFAIVTAQDGRSTECQNAILGVKSIGLHVRRADYVNLPSCNAFHGTCSKEYYDAALNLILGRLGADIQLFVFSDDMGWVRENIRYPFPTTYVDWNQNRSYEDLRLMSSCRALIMANSTFSWWAGWVNSWPDKIVVAPQQWYREPGVVSDLPLSPWLIAI